MKSAMKSAKAKVLCGPKSLGYEILATSSRRQPSTATPAGCLPVYIGEERWKFIIPIEFLSHPLFRMLLEKASVEYGFEQRDGLSLPCSVSVFQEVLSAVKSFHGQFNLQNLVEALVY